MRIRCSELRTRAPGRVTPGRLESGARRAPGPRGQGARSQRPKGGMEEGGRNFRKARALYSGCRLRYGAGAGIPFAAPSESQRVPDCGRTVHSSLRPPKPERRPVLRRAATLASVASIVRLSDTLGPSREERTQCVARPTAAGGAHGHLTLRTPPAGPGSAGRSRAGRSAPVARHSRGRRLVRCSRPKTARLQRPS